MLNVACSLRAARISRIRGVNAGSGPSSNVKANTGSSVGTDQMTRRTPSTRGGPPVIGPAELSRSTSLRGTPSSACAGPSVAVMRPATTAPATPSPPSRKPRREGRSALTVHSESAPRSICSAGSHGVLVEPLRQVQALEQELHRGGDGRRALVVTGELAHRLPQRRHLRDELHVLRRRHVLAHV